MHTFRHTYRSLAAAAEIPLATIKDLMRHTTMATSMNVYGAPVESSVREVREAQGKIVKLLSGG
jgi:integrase